MGPGRTVDVTGSGVLLCITGFSQVTSGDNRGLGCSTFELFLRLPVLVVRTGRSN